MKFKTESSQSGFAHVLIVILVSLLGFGIVIFGLQSGGFLDNKLAFSTPLNQTAIIKSLKQYGTR